MPQGFRPGADPLTKRSSRVVAVRKLARRKVRDERRQFLAEGPQAVAEALRRSGTVVELFASAPAAERYDELIDLAVADGVSVHEVTDDGLAALTETVTPQGLVAVCRYLDVDVPSSPRLVAVLDGISDPGNAGTILRAADATGADATVFPDATVDPYNGKCVRSSVGSLFHLPVVRGGDTATIVERLRADGLRVLAADAHGDTDLDDLIDAGSLVSPTAWLFGSEAHGLPEHVAALADARVKVPIYGHAESLNLATAATVCLYASARQHRRGAPQ
ncbi:TrmH family RNA methyltransferase [Stackebrandtia soli]|uniref:TrmH family RNA methyltransferase n=1 Tax=Stackebrandtia soli TaxID=1892856 RepID=UPI0039EC0005